MLSLELIESPQVADRDYQCCSAFHWVFFIPFKSAFQYLSSSGVQEFLGQGSAQ